VACGALEGCTASRSTTLAALGVLSAIGQVAQSRGRAGKSGAAARRVAGSEAAEREVATEAAARAATKGVAATGVAKGGAGTEVAREPSAAPVTAVLLATSQFRAPVRDGMETSEEAGSAFREQIRLILGKD